jgi:hypothetical protein
MGGGEEEENKSAFMDEQHKEEELQNPMRVYPESGKSNLTVLYVQPPLPKKSWCLVVNILI